MKPTARYFGMIRRSQTRVADLERVIPTKTTKEVSSSNQTRPFTVLYSGGTDLTVYPGLVNGALPTGWDTTFTVSPSGVYYVKLSVTSDGQSVTACSLEVDGTPVSFVPVVLGSAPLAFGYLLAVVSSGRKFQISTGNMVFAPSRVFVKTKAGGAGIGESPYDFGYTWAWTVV